jgi:xylulokinase
MSAQKALKKITVKINPENIKALAISNQRETFVPLDKDGNPLRPAIIWLDERCKDQVEPFSKAVGKNKIRRITGKPVDYAPVVYRLAWMKKYEPELFEKIHMICDVNSFLVQKLSGSYKTSRSSADPLGVFDLKKEKWSSLILKRLDLKEDQFPSTYCPGAVMGKISNTASALTGLMTDTMIISGGGDGQAAGLGANVLSGSRAYLNLGTAVVAGVFGKRYKTSNAFRTMGSCSDAGYYYECSLRSGTFAVDWFIKRILNIDPTKEPGIYQMLQNEAEQIPAGSGGLLHVPYLCGVMNPYWDINARGIFVGLSSSHNRGHMYRAILEGIAFEQTLAIDAVEKNTGCKVMDFVAIGGGASNGLWCSIFADITGRNICLPVNTEASCLGAGIAAAVGAGWYGTFEQAADNMTGVRETIKPDLENYNNYRRIYRLYKKIYPALRKVVTL